MIPACSQNWIFCDLISLELVLLPLHSIEWSSEVNWDRFTAFLMRLYSQNGMKCILVSISTSFKFKFVCQSFFLLAANWKLSNLLKFQFEAQQFMCKFIAATTLNHNFNSLCRAPSARRFRLLYHKKNESFLRFSIRKVLWPTLGEHRTVSRNVFILFSFIFPLNHL